MSVASPISAECNRETQSLLLRALLVHYLGHVTKKVEIVKCKYKGQNTERGETGHPTDDGYATPTQLLGCCSYVYIKTSISGDDYMRDEKYSGLPVAENRQMLCSTPDGSNP